MDINIIAEQNIIGTEFGYCKYETWYKTTDLRYANKSIPIDENIGRNELRLQQKWISDRGNEKWEWIPEFTEEKFYSIAHDFTKQNYTIQDIVDKVVELSKEKIQSGFSSANLSDLQIEKVVEWMNTWEQLKDTAIPIRFEEDFTNKKFEFKGFDSKNYRFSPKGEIGDKLKVEKILPKEDVDTFKKEIQSMISADISHLTFTTELNNGNFVFYKDNHKPFEYSGKISEMTFSDKLAIVEKIESYAEELDVNLKLKGKFIIPK